MGEKWKRRRESEGWPEEAKAASDGENMVAARGGGSWEEVVAAVVVVVREVEMSWRVRDMET